MVFFISFVIFLFLLDMSSECSTCAFTVHLSDVEEAGAIAPQPPPQEQQQQQQEEQPQQQQ